jgi:CubicO group peptidase (beta-lactamase class C family)
MDLTADLRARIDDFTAALIVEHRLPSLVLGLAVGSDLVHVSSAASPSQPTPTERTPYRIASMTKSFTAAAVLVLRDRGRLRLDDRIAELAPELAGVAGPTCDSPPISVRHLLSMGGGLAGDDPWADRLLHADQATMDVLFSDGVRFGLTPGHGFLYSNFGYAMLGRIITNVSGMSFQDFVTAELLSPLALAHTGWHPPAGSATAHRTVDDGWGEEPVLDDGGFAAMGGLWSTVADLARWCGWLAHAFPPRDDPDSPILSRASRREMQHVVTAWAPVLSADDAGPRVMAGGYGFGLNVYTDTRLGTVVEHSGGLPGFGSNMRWLPDRQVSVIALANLRYAPARLATQGVLDLLAAHDLLPPVPVSVPDDLQRCAQALVGLLNDWSSDQAADLFSFNVDLDDDLATRRQVAAQRLTDHGPLTITGITALNATEADVALADSRAVPLTLSLMLSPQPQPRIQWYELGETVA